MAWLVLAAGCASPKLPERFHTLLPGDRAEVAAAGGHAIHVDVTRVSVPPQVDHAQWVVRQPDDSLLMLEQDRWAAPLAEELRGAVVERLATRWSAVDVRGVATPASGVWRLRIDVQRFESIPGREARIEATWSLSSSHPGGASLVCRSVLHDEVDQASVPALAAAHRRAVVRLADEIGQRLAEMHAGRAVRC